MGETTEDLAARFPEWHIYRSVTRRWWYASVNGSSPQIRVRGRTLEDLRLQIHLANGRRAIGYWKAELAEREAEQHRWDQRRNN